MDRTTTGVAGLWEFWAAGWVSLNGWCSIGNPFTAGIMAEQGADSVTVDMQRGAQNLPP
ncbi:MAG: hypothetical protein ACRC14_10900 [Paracoccaceae bacterium]